MSSKEMRDNARFEYLKERISDLIMEAQGLHREIKDILDVYEAGECGACADTCEDEPKELGMTMGTFAVCPDCGTKVIVVSGLGKDSREGWSGALGGHIDFLTCGECGQPFVCRGFMAL